MYDNYFTETSIQGMRLRRFRNFVKGGSASSVSRDHTFHEAQLVQNHFLPAVHIPDELQEELHLHDVHETPRLFLRTPYGSLNKKGEGYLVAFDELMVLMWKTDEEITYSFVKLEKHEIHDISGELEASNDELIVLRIIAEVHFYSMWFSEAQADEVVEFINTWKVYIAHMEDESFMEDVDLEEEAEEEAEEELVLGDIPDISNVPQRQLPRTVIFGTVLIGQMADENHNITASDLEFLSMIVSNPELLTMCINNFKVADPVELREVIRSNFTADQKLMLVANMADLAYREGEPHQTELDELEKYVIEIGFSPDELHRLLNIFRVKNEPAILEEY